MWAFNSAVQLLTYPGDVLAHEGEPMENKVFPGPPQLPCWYPWAVSQAPFLGEWFRGLP